MFKIRLITAGFICLSSLLAPVFSAFTPFAELAFAQNVLQQLDVALSELATEIAPSVVRIQTNAYAPTTTQPNGPALALQTSTGSGVILSPDGLIVTNAHVVAGATQIQVQLAALVPSTGRSIIRPRGRRLSADLLGIDLETDLALLKVQATDLPMLNLADSEQIYQGQVVLALGSPLGLENSVSMGIVSSIARQLEEDSSMIYIQTDAAVNPGNSGGPLVDVDGNLIGINTLSLSSSGESAGLGFAVPSNIVRTVVEQLRDNGVFTRGEIGVEAQTITPELAEGLGLSQDYGVLLADVFPRSAAENAGMRVGDIVLAMNGKPMENARQFQVNLYGQLSNQTVQLDLLRGNEELSTFVVLRARRNEPQQLAQMLDRTQRVVARLGILAVAVEDDDIGNLLPILRRPGGILVTNLAATAAAPNGLFQSGDVIYSLNNRPLLSIDELEAVLDSYESGDTIVLQVERAGRLSFVAAPVY